MPTVPTYEPGQVRNTPLPTVRSSANATAASFGGAAAEALGDVGQAMSRAGNVASNIAIDQQEKENSDIVRSQMNEARLEMNKIAQQEYSRNGSDAFGASKRISDEARKLAQNYAKNFKNGRQQEMFNQVFDTYSNEHVMRAQTHEANQREVFHRQTLDAENQVNSEELAANMNDPAFVEDRLADIISNVKAANSGAGDIGVKVKKHVSAVLLDAVARKSQDDPASALQFLETHKSKMDPQTASRVGKALQGKVDDLRVAGAVMDVTSVPGATLESSVAAIDSMKLDPEQKEKALKAVRTQIEIRDSAKDATERKQTEAAWNSFYQAPSMETIAKLNLSPAEKNKMQDALGKMVNKRTDEQYATEYGKLLRLPNDQFIKTNLDEKRFDISPEQYERLKKSQAELRKSGKETIPGFSKAITDATAEAAQLSQFKIKDDETTEEKLKKQDLLNQFATQYEERLLQKAKDKPIDADMRKEVRDSLIVEHVEKGWIWDTKTIQYNPKPQFTTKEEVREAFKANKLTREQARQELNKLGVQ
jgi:hypothetical protein